MDAIAVEAVGVNELCVAGVLVACVIVVAGRVVEKAKVLMSCER